MKSLTLAAAAALVTLSLASPAMAQYRSYYNSYYPYSNPSVGYNYYGNPYYQSYSSPRVFGQGYTYQNQSQVYGYNPNVYGYNPNVYFRPSTAQMYQSYYTYPNPQTYTYSWIR